VAVQDEPLVQFSTLHGLVADIEFFKEWFKFEDEALRHVVLMSPQGVFFL
jgi:hypothetical protein